MLPAVSLSHGYIAKRKWWKARLTLEIYMTLAATATVIRVHPREDESEVKCSYVNWLAATNLLHSLSPHVIVH
jgi:hypothetical protein